jgi:TolB-like protein/tRNA A-37 threonylcarbamoyl transferase component Bud32
MTTVSSPLADALRDRYVLERELGRGGMATVYLAEDLKHDRQVALKVLHPELAATVGPDRFQREIRTTARLQHPHILPVLDSGEAAGQLWYTMPFVRGESLRGRLLRETQLQVDSAIELTRQIALALDYAHREGVVHRDLKPENILLADGQALVADFGVAKAVNLADQGQLTGTGMAVGTPTYMSPEQATGGAVDARSDIYALGCVLYEMLAGEPPYTGATAQAILAKRVLEPVPHVRTLRESVPEHLEQATARALARVPADRFQTAAEFARALSVPVVANSVGSQSEVATPLGTPTPRWLSRPATVLVLGFGLLIGVGVLFAWLYVHGGAGVIRASAKRVAVLPFENLGDSGDAYFADGVADEVRGKLAALPGIEVIARGSSSQYQRTTKPPHQIARELGVDYLLTATLRWERRAGDESRVRLSPELVDAASGVRRWQQNFDAPLTDIFRVEAEVANSVAEALGVALRSGERRRLTEQPTSNLEAYAHYLRGREMSSGEFATEALRGAAAEYSAAVHLDSTFAAAWAELSVAHAVLFRMGGVQAADTRVAREAVERAIMLSPESPDTRLAAAQYAGVLAGQGDTAALRELRAGLEVAPNRADLLARAGNIEVGLGRTEQGLRDLEHAARLDPRSPSGLAALAWVYLRLQRVPEAEAMITRARAVRPGTISLGYRHAYILAAKGDLDSLRRVLHTMEQMLGSRPVLAYVALREDLITVLDSAQLRLTLTLTPADLDNGRGDWALALAEGHWLLGNRSAAQAYGDTAAAAYATLERSVGAHMSQDDLALQYSLRALALAYAGRAADAAAGVRRAIAASPGPMYGNVHRQAARTYLLTGYPEQALDHLELLITAPTSSLLRYTPAWLRIDPAFASLRGDARFEQLARGPS